MSKIILKAAFLLTITLAILTSCNKENTSATVIRDCTGTYLRFSSKDWPVCNSDFISEIPNNEKIKVTYKKVESGKCVDKGKPVCMMVHPNTAKEWIEITKVK